MRTTGACTAPAPATTIRFAVDGRWYETPETWMARRIRARRALGANPNEAAIATNLDWAEKESLESARRDRAGLPAADEGRLLA